jgi:hypothetical protein
MGKYSDFKIVGLGREDDPKVLDRIEATEREVSRELGEVRVNFRWGAQQLARVKEAARLQGLPYQVYIKKALYDRATADLAAYYDLEAVRKHGEAPAGKTKP